MHPFTVPVVAFNELGLSGYSLLTAFTRIALSLPDKQLIFREVFPKLFKGK
jgi:hypothetical protein